MTVIDIHTHWVPRSFPAPDHRLSATGWPEMVALGDGRSQMVIDGNPFRIFESSYWNVSERLATMDQDGVTMQILSPLPELLGYWLEPATAAALGGYINQTIADAIDIAPARFSGMGTLPLQDIELSLEGLPEISRLGLRGIIAASNINGVSIADPRFHPVMAELERRELVLFVHGYRPAGTERMVGSPLLGAIIGVPQDTMAAIASFIMTDVLGRFPALKICFVQGGGTFGAVVDRLDHSWQGFPQLQQAVAMSPRAYARRFFFDSVTFSVPYLRFLIETFGAQTLVTGSDGPAAIGQRGLESFVRQACGADEASAEAILWRNAAALFRLPQITEHSHAAPTLPRGAS